MSTNLIAIAAAALLYVRNAESNAVRQLTPDQAARCHESSAGSNNYVDAAGVITGTIFSGFAAPDVYSRAYDRWYDPTSFASAEVADESFAAQSCPRHDEPEQWWVDPTEAPSSAPESGAPDSTPSAVTEATDEQASQQPAIVEEPEPETSEPATKPALVLSAEQHAKSKSLAAEIDEHIHAIGGSVAAKWRALRKLLGHVL